MQKATCVVCRTTGKHGAEWLAVIGSAKDSVHRPCGERLVEHAKQHGEPGARLIRSEALRQKHKAEAQERQVKAFWAEKFQKAEAKQVKAPEASTLVVSNIVSTGRTASEIILGRRAAAGC